jgi:hypothetical protein
MGQKVRLLGATLEEQNRQQNVVPVRVRDDLEATPRRTKTLPTKRKKRTLSHHLCTST